MMTFPCDNCKYKNDKRCISTVFKIIDGFCTNFQKLETGEELQKEDFKIEEKGEMYISENQIIG